jgi:hypothetical protein
MKKLISALTLLAFLFLMIDVPITEAALKESSPYSAKIYTHNPPPMLKQTEPVVELAEQNEPIIEPTPEPTGYIPFFNPRPPKPYDRIYTN